MRNSTLLLSLGFIVSCTQKQEKVAGTHELSRPTIRVIEASFPLYLDSVLVTRTGTSPSPKLDRALQGVVEDFYFNQCAGDSSETFCRLADALLFTVKLPGRTSDYYLLIVQHVPQGFVTGRLISWDQREERIIAGTADVRFAGMYNVRNGELQRSNLKKLFKITGPELELMDTLGREAIIVRRLWHNGTFNSMERTALSFDQGRLDTLFSSLSPFSAEPISR
jgi:hypothetical protein